MIVKLTEAAPQKLRDRIGDNTVAASPALGGGVYAFIGEKVIRLESNMVEEVKPS
jgi:hypothetical protein